MRLTGHLCAPGCHDPKFILAVDSIGLGLGLGIDVEINPRPIPCKQAATWTAISHLTNIVCSISYIYLSIV